MKSWIKIIKLNKTKNVNKEKQQNFWMKKTYIIFLRWHLTLEALEFTHSKRGEVHHLKQVLVM